MTSFEGRISDHPVAPIFLERWSPRAFTGDAIRPAEFMTILEAARWAPSASNQQPWRFLYAYRDTPHWEGFLGLLGASNQVWANRAAVLIVALSKTTALSSSGQDVPSYSHSFDAGAAWQSIALQATMLGWHAHGMVGLDMPRAAKELGVPDGYRVECAIAIGRRGDKSMLPEAAQARETPNGRNPVGSFAFEGAFPAV